MHRTRNRLLGITIILILALVALAAVACLWQSLSQAAYRAIGLACIFLLICCLYLFILVATVSNPSKHPVIKHLQSNNGDIVWVYSFISINMPFGVHMFKLVTIWLHYRDGSQQHLRISHRYLEACMHYLETLLPHATFGHSVKKEQLYRANPELLLRD